MSDYELLSIVLMMLSIIVTIMLAYINTKKVTAHLFAQRITVTLL